MSVLRSASTRLIAASLLLVLALAGCAQTTTTGGASRTSTTSSSPTERYLSAVLQPPRGESLGRLSRSQLLDTGADVCLSIGEPGVTARTASDTVKQRTGLSGGDAMRLVIAAQGHVCSSKFWAEPSRPVSDAVERVPGSVSGPVTEAPEPTPAGPATFMSDGIHEVGVDVQPGKWKTAGGEGCYWTRLSGAGGSLDDIIANNLGDGQQIVTIKAGEFFESKRCGTWTLR